jgi:hypothetical protein
MFGDNSFVSSVCEFKVNGKKCNPHQGLTTPPKKGDRLPKAMFRNSSMASMSPVIAAPIKEEEDHSNSSNIDYFYTDDVDEKRINADYYDGFKKYSDSLAGDESDDTDDAVSFAGDDDDDESVDSILAEAELLNGGSPLSPLIVDAWKKVAMEPEDFALLPLAGDLSDDDMGDRPPPTLKMRIRAKKKDFAKPPLGKDAGDDGVDDRAAATPRMKNYSNEMVVTPIDDSVA